MAKIDLIISGIRCDSCAWMNLSVPYEQYPEYVNRPCPCCGENLLTEEDYATTQTIVAYANSANELYKDVPDTEERSVKRIHMSGTGEVSFEDIQQKEIEYELAD